MKVQYNHKIRTQDLMFTFSQLQYTAALKVAIPLQL